MYEIKAIDEVIDGHELTVYSRDVVNCNILEVSAGTTGFCGGDSGHGCRTYIRIKDQGGTDLRAKVVPSRYSANNNAAESIEIVLGGDTELETIIEGLEFILQALKDDKEKQ